jgi:hypothetical protein
MLFEQCQDFCRDGAPITLRAFAKCFISIVKNVFDVYRCHLALTVLVEELFGGDGDAAAAERSVQPLEFLDPKLASFALLGGHDIFFEKSRNFGSDRSSVALGLISQGLIEVVGDVFYV